jgi:hypothetical protein
MKRLWAVILAALLAGLLVGSPAYADTPNPDEVPTFVQVDVYRNLLETGDRLYLAYINIPYGTLPDTDVTETFILRLIDTDGTTVLGSTTGYDFNDDGYGYNVWSLYFPAADALTWEALYTLRLSGNPVVFDTPPIYNFSITAGDYTLMTTQAENQQALATRILALADDLDDRWDLAVTSSLLWEAEIGTVLSMYGESFFRGAIYGVQALAPLAFAYALYDIEIDDRTWSDNYTSVLEDQWAGTWVAEAKTGSTNFFGTEFDLLTLLLLVATCVGIFLANQAVSKGGEIWPALTDVGFVLVVGSRLGMYNLGYLALIAALAVIYLGLKLWGLR